MPGNWLQSILKNVVQRAAKVPAWHLSEYAQQEIALLKVKTHMKMNAVEARLAELESRRVQPGLSVSEQNELRDCEITLGMVEAPSRARAEAALAAWFAAERAAKAAT